MQSKDTHSRMNRVAGTVARGAVVAALVATIGPMAAMAETSYDLSTIANGTYTGTATVTDSNDPDENEYDSYTVTATVTVDGHAIKSVEVTSTATDSTSVKDFGWAKDGRSNRSETGVPAQIVAKNSTDVDSVTGATVSSTAITQAVDNALANAKTEDSTGLSVGSYALVNIPFDEFYAAETGSNTTDVDVLTSATKSKTQGELAGSTYHTEDGSQITGVTYAVKVGDDAAAKALSAYTKVDSSDDLGTAASYSYVVLSEEPASYKTVTADAKGNLTFSAVSDAKTAKTISVTDAKLSEHTTWGDYELDFDTDVYNTIHTDDAVIAGAVINTTDGSGYGLRPLANIWNATRGQIVEFAWSTQQDEVHEVQTNAAYYQSLMGKTIDSVTVYTDKGTYVIDVNNLYVPIMSSKDSVSAENVDLDSTSTVNVTTTLPDFKNPTYTLDGAEVTVSNGTITLPEGTKPGTHTFTAKDGANKYADVSITFVASTAKVVAAYDASTKSLVAADGATADDLANYIANISSVTVDGTAYATGRRGTTIVNSDGTIALDVTSGRGDEAVKIFTAGTHTVSVASTGYTAPLEFTVDAEDEAVAVYRLYNPYDYFRLYTTDATERDNLLSLGWNDEGVGWQSPETGTAVYRLYNQYNGEHLYTVDKAEYDNLVSIGWTGEETAFYSADAADGVEVKRFYNPWVTGVGSTHHYTTSAEEAATMVEAGWIEEGVAFYGVKQD